MAFFKNTLYNWWVTKLALLLHLYQPVTQDEKTFRGITESSYIPLVKLIKNRKLHISLNIPLSLLEQMDKYGYKSWINDVKDLVDQEIINITGSAAYHALLTKLPEEVAQQQIILNEYGNGFYLGRRTGFEGEQAVLVRDFYGFFPPELAINENIHKILTDLGYKWTIVNSSATSGSHGVFRLSDRDCLLVARNKLLSDLLAFKRDTEVSDIVSSLLSSEDSVLALDAETFGHHNRDGIFLLGKLIDALNDRGVQIVTVDEFVEYAIDESKVKTADSLVESTWADMSPDVYSYHLWEGNSVQDLQWELFSETIKTVLPLIEKKKYEDLENVSLWDGDLPKDIQEEILFHKVLQSDQFWWTSGETVAETYLFNSTMVERDLDLYQELSELLGDPKYEKLVTEYKERIKEEIKKHETSNTTTLLPAA